MYSPTAEVLPWVRHTVYMGDAEMYDLLKTIGMEMPLHC